VVVATTVVWSDIWPVPAQLQLVSCQVPVVGLVLLVEDSVGGSLPEVVSVDLVDLALPLATSAVVQTISLVTARHKL